MNTQANTAGPQNATPGITYGGPQTDLSPIPGSTLRDAGGANGGVPVYSREPRSLPGAPVNGTANAYDVPPSGLAPGRTAPTTGSIRDNSTSFTRRPPGGVPYTRDQIGNLGGRGGYTAGGVYNGTAAQQNGIGYGSPYAPNGRPTGGLLSNNVDATGPLRPYIPLNTGTTGRPNSGYGIPNGSRATTMDGRGIQRTTR